jgi:hypothetical protein
LNLKINPASHCFTSIAELGKILGFDGGKLVEEEFEDGAGGTALEAFGAAFGAATGELPLINGGILGPYWTGVESSS